MCDPLREERNKFPLPLPPPPTLKSVCSVISLHSCMSRAIHPKEFLKLDVDHRHIPLIDSLEWSVPLPCCCVLFVCRLGPLLRLSQWVTLEGTMLHFVAACNKSVIRVYCWKKTFSPYFVHNNYDHCFLMLNALHTFNTHVTAGKHVQCLLTIDAFHAFNTHVMTGIYARCWWVLFIHLTHM